MSTDKVSTSGSEHASHSLLTNNNNQQTLLPTATILVTDKNGTNHTCRALLDSGSQSNFITTSLCKKLGITMRTLNTQVSGINQSSLNINKEVTVTIKSRTNNYETSISCLVLPQITRNLPTSTFNATSFRIPENLVLADPQFSKGKQVDLLIGSSIFWNLLCVGQIKLGSQGPILQKTRFGWIIAGPFNIASFTTNVVSYCTTTQGCNLNKQIENFWELESVGSERILTPEEKFCENHFVKTYTRNEEGRFIVNIPFKDNVDQLGVSRHVALKRFYSLERRLQNCPELKGEYIQFITQYKNLNHMTKVDENDLEKGLCYYLPHHAILKPSSTTTKLRVVFDGSCKTDTMISLNDTQMVGPTIQDDLISILLRFRKYNYVMTGDVAKMYRQVLVDQNQRRFQRIFWRDEPNQPVQCFELNTVTYGTASALFLAVRCIQQLALDYQIRNPNASRTIANDFYVDDLLTGTQTIDDLIRLKNDITLILKEAGFELRKWLSNYAGILDESTKGQNLDVDLDLSKLWEQEPDTKMLGITWNPRSDHFKYTINMNTHNQSITKRSILSIISKVFDPLGLLSPVTINGKLLMQRLWIEGCSWDESLPAELHTQWQHFSANFQSLNEIKIPRHVMSEIFSHVELHGFCDASERAYGACIYIKSIDNSNHITVRLLCSKSRVSPLKTVSLLRLELCGALLFAQLVQKIRKSINVNFNNKLLWCDSTVTLGWINGSPHRFKTFVANRVCQIQELTSVKAWHHVRSADNPADLITRGLGPHKIAACTSWWNGPQWLHNCNPHLSASHFAPQDIKDLPETKSTTCAHVITIQNVEIFKKFSSFNKLKRVVSWCFRFLHNSARSRNERKIGPLDVVEIQTASTKLIKLAQQQNFADQIKQLRKSENLKGKLLALNPFLDENGLIRVGGRLRHSNYAYEKKHPIILDPHHPLTELILRSEHLRLLHCGPRSLLASIREQFWPVSGMNLAKKITRQCVTCFKAQPYTTDYLMGDLPDNRIIYSPLLRTRAVHLELVTDLTTESFIASLRRFTSRRGKPQHIYSDNGTNFIGAKAEIRRLTNFLRVELPNNNFQNSLSSDNISWHLIPPRSPHFGGVWEAGVKSTKTHLTRVIGNNSFTFEQFYTILVQIEAVLNSRPLSPLSSDPKNLNPLTPSHFLIGRALTAIPDPDVTAIQQNRLSLYQHIQQLVQHFWRRWNKEYIAELQTRVKWQRNFGTMLKPGALVLLKEDNTPPLYWRLARVIQLHPGPDGITRVVSVQCANAILKRAVKQVCVLPIENND